MTPDLKHEIKIVCLMGDIVKKNIPILAFGEAHSNVMIGLQGKLEKIQKFPLSKYLEMK